MNREHVQVSARTWRNGTISMGAAPHGACRRCGGAIWWGSVTFKGKTEPSWIAYSEAGHGGGGTMVMERHDCQKPSHREAAAAVGGAR